MTDYTTKERITWTLAINGETAIAKGTSYDGLYLVDQSFHAMGLFFTQPLIDIIFSRLFECNMSKGESDTIDYDGNTEFTITDIQYTDLS